MSEQVFDRLKTVTPSIAKRLIERGYYSVEKLAIAKTEELAENLHMQNVGVATTQKIIDEAREVLGFKDFKLASEVIDNSVYYSTNSSKLDLLLGKGIRTKTITEFVGDYATGKTQICKVLSVNVADTGSDVIFMDTESTFSPTRVKEIAEEKGLTPKFLS